MSDNAIGYPQRSLSNDIEQRARLSRRPRLWRQFTFTLLSN